MTKISHCLWFDSQAEEAAKFYTSIFKGKIGKITHYTEAGFEFHQRPTGSVMGVEFEILGQRYLGINGGPLFQFNEAFSIVVTCENQKEIDYYWKELTANGGQEVQCGWLKDRYGVSWQVTPSILDEMLSSSDRKKVERVTDAYMQMKKFDIETLKKAFQ